MADILVFCEKPTNALEYVLDFISRQFKELNFELTSSKDAFISSTKAKINYHTIPIVHGELLIYNTFYLQNVLQIPYPMVQKLDQSIILFPDNGDGNMGFDIFTAIFWMLTNYEERYTEKRDGHGRFLYEQSIQAKFQTIKTPIVDIWLELLLKQLDHKFELKVSRSTNYSWTLGIDVDMPWKYKYKSLLKQISGIFKSLFLLDIGNFLERIKVHLSLQNDPFDCFEKFKKLERSNLIFFILQKTGAAIDSTHSLQSRYFQKLIHALALQFRIGLHPSYYSIEQPELISAQKYELESVLGQKVSHSRQHYLRFKIPETFRAITCAGIQEDYSMMFADQCGFRNGTVHSFRFYDLEDNKVLDLTIHPVVAMDRTLLQYQHKSAEASLQEIHLLIEQCKRYKGQCHVIWHNSSFDFKAEWKGWENVFDKMLELLKNQEC